MSQNVCRYINNEAKVSGHKKYAFGFILYLCLMLPLLLAVVEAAESLAGWNLGISKSTYNEDGNFTLKLREETSETFNINCDGCDHDPGSSYSLKIHNHEPHIAKLKVV